MRESAELGDDVAVQFGEVCARSEGFAQRPGHAVRERIIDTDRFFLDLQGFGVLQRHEEEDALLGGQMLMVAAHRALDAQPQGMPIAREGLRFPAIDVAAELVEKDDQRQASLGLPRPLVQLAGRGAAHEFAEALGDLPIEFRIRAEPAIHAAIQRGRVEVAAGKPVIQYALGFAVFHNVASDAPPITSPWTQRTKVHISATISPIWLRRPKRLSPGGIVPYNRSFWAADL